MSGSEDEATFASADEGEEETTSVKKTSHPASAKSDKVPKEKEGVGTGGEGDTKAGLAAASPPAKEDVKKGRGKQQQQQRNKQKGKNGNQPLEKDSPTKSTDTKDTKQESPSKPKEQKPSGGARPKGEPKDVKSESSKTSEDTKPAGTPSKLANKDSKKDIQSSGKEDTKTEESDSVGKHTEDRSSPAKATGESPSGTGKGGEGVTKQAGDVRRGLQSTAAESPVGQDIPREQRDHHTTQQEEVLKELGESAVKGGGWGWSSWGSSLLSAASNSVQTFTHQVGDGFSTIIETVESSLGVPDPEELAKAQGVTEPTPTLEEAPAVTSQPAETQAKTEPQKQPVKPKPEKKAEDAEMKASDEKEEGKKEGEVKAQAGSGHDGNSWFASWGVADLAKRVQNTGKSLAAKGHTLMSEGFDAMEHLASGGIDVLETIGKKTYSTISEHDPAFRKTREFLTPRSNKPNLSGILREAKDKAEREAEQARENEEARKAHFGTLFDDYQGIAHLEALEILSNQSEKKVHSLLNSLSSEDLASIKPGLISIKQAFEVSEEDEESENTKEQDFSKLVSQYLSELQLGTAPDKLNKVHDMVKQWIVDFDSHESHETDSIKEVHQKSIQALAELTAKGVEQFHKAGELVLMERDKDKDCTERAHSLARLTGVLCHEIGNLASKFVDCLNKMADKDANEEITPLVTNVYLEATNSSTYIQDAFQLLLPVLQHAAIEHTILSRQASS